MSEALDRTIRYRDVPPPDWTERIRKAGVPPHLLGRLVVMAGLRRWAAATA